MDSLVKDILIIATNNLHLMESLLREQDVALDQAIQSGLAAEEMKSQARISPSRETYEADITAISHRHRKRGIFSDLNSPK